MATDFAGAVMHWWEHIQRQPGGLAKLSQPATVSTMLYACGRYLDAELSDPSLSEERARIKGIRRELQNWQGERGLSFKG